MPDSYETETLTIHIDEPVIGIYDNITSYDDNIDIDIDIDNDMYSIYKTYD